LQRQNQHRPSKATASVIRHEKLSELLRRAKRSRKRRKALPSAILSGLPKELGKKAMMTQIHPVTTRLKILNQQKSEINLFHLFVIVNETRAAPS